MHNRTRTIVEAVVHHAGLTSQSAAARVWDRKFRFGGARIPVEKKQPYQPNQEHGGTLTAKERRYRGQKS